MLAICVVALVAFWLGLALDYLPVMLGGTEMPWLARALLLTVLTIAISIIVVKLLLGRLHRPLPDDSLALLVERHHPSLGGRLITAVQLNQDGRDGDSHSPELLRKVHQQAAEAIDKVDPNRIFRWEPLARKAMIAGPLVLMMLLFAVISPSAFGRAVGRLTLLSDEPWPRRADLEMVGIELPVVSASESETIEPELQSFEQRSLRLPKGSNGTLRIKAQAEDAEVPVVCTVYYRTESGTRGQSNMRRVGRVKDGYQSFVLDGPPLAGLSESFTFNVHGLDDRLDGYSVTAVQPPAITSMNVQVRYPNYLRSEGAGEFDLQTDYKAGLRVSEGSDVTLSATSSVPLGDVDIMLKTDGGERSAESIRFSEDRLGVRVSIDDFAAPTTIRIVPRDDSGISAQAAYRYFLSAVVDEPPELELSLQGVGTAVTPIARLPIQAAATDDYGVEQLRVLVTPSSDQPETRSASETLTMDRDGQASSVIDLRDLVADKTLDQLKPGEAINVFGEASDKYDLGTSHLTRSEVFRLQVVTAEELLALLERRELAMRSRLEQTIDETRGLRDALDALRRRGFEAENQPKDEQERTRQEQVWRLRVQQRGLQAQKTSEELSGIAASLDDLLQEMVNNRVDSTDRRKRIGQGVRDPLKKIVSEPLAKLIEQIKDVEEKVDNPQKAAEITSQAVQTAEEVLLQLTAVLDKMLDIESYNEILDIVRGLIDDLDQLSEDTEKEHGKSFRKFFED